MRCTAISAPNTQPHQTASYLIFVAEVASTCNEILLTRYLLSHTGDEVAEGLHYQPFSGQLQGNPVPSDDVRGVRDDGSPQGGGRREALTAGELNRIYYDLNVKYFGPDMAVDQEIRLEWARIPHFYTPFYVYQYATGISAAAALSERILTLGEAGVKDYMKFLTGGGSAPIPSIC